MTPQEPAAGVALLALLASLAACAGPRLSQTGSPDPVGPPCLILSGSPAWDDTLVVALPGPLGANAEITLESPAERFIADQVNRSEGGNPVDCAGRPDSIRTPEYRIASQNPAILEPVSPGSSLPVIRIEPTTLGTDLRDLLDRGIQVVITADPATLDYARLQGSLGLVPLAWATSYVLVASPGAALPVVPAETWREDLALEAVRVLARPSELAIEALGLCPGRPSAGPPRVEGIAVPSGDAVAYALAERLVALSGPSPTPGARLRVVAYPAPTFDSLLAAGTVSAFVTPFPRYPRGDCRGVPPIPAGSLRVPLIDTRATAVVRPGVPAFLTRGDGGIRFLPRRVP